MMISDIMTRTDETTKMKLLALVNHFLTRMFTINASDIDMEDMVRKAISVSSVGFKKIRSIAWKIFTG